jgi:hypothetical protein
LFEILVSYRLAAMALICKQHILSPVKVKELDLCYSLAEICHVCLFEFIQVEGAVKFMKKFKGEHLAWVMTLLLMAL